jgi:hypothetical protein
LEVVVAPHEQIEELRSKIENFKRTRRMSKGAIRDWVNSLIEDAEEELRRLTSTDREPHLSAEISEHVGLK